MSKWIFENIFVDIVLPKKQLRVPCSTRPPAASRWRDARPTQQPSDAPAKERASMTDSASGGLEKAPSRGRICSLPGMAENRKKMEIPALYTVPTHVLLYIPARHGTNSVPPHVLLCDITTASSCVRTRRAGGMERRGEAKTAIIPVSLWHMVQRTSHCYLAFFLVSFFCHAIIRPSPCLWRSSAYFLLHCCTAVILLSHTHIRG